MLEKQSFLAAIVTPQEELKNLSILWRTRSIWMMMVVCKTAFRLDHRRLT